MGMLDILCAVVEAAAMLAVVWLLVAQAFEAAITIGTFVMLFEAFRRGQGYLTSLVSSIAALYDNKLFVGNLFDFLEFEPQITVPAEPLPVPEKIESVEFRDITFRYPDMDRDVLSHYSLTARVGEVTRIEGENGYGKSTLVKLLLRLYDPQQGSVLVNGIDIRRFDPAALRKSVGVLFQDFVRYNITAAENIGFDNTEGVTDAALLAGADSFLGRLQHGYDNMLGRLFDGGAELSMGQWQRVAIARMLHTNAPVLLLDEPMAWMDMPTREHFLRVVESIKHDKIVIMITHA
jgi:ATP-binding cassette subfamily B protein